MNDVMPPSTSSPGPILPPPPAPSQRRSRAGLLIGIGCFGCLGLTLGVVALIAGGTYFIFQKGGALLNPPLEAYLNAVNAEDYERAFAMLDPEWQAAQPIEDWIAFEQSIRADLGRFQSMSMRSVNMSSDMEGSTASAEYLGRFSEGECTLRTRFRYSDGAWKLVELTYADYAPREPVE